MYSLAEVDNLLPPVSQLSALSTEAAAGPRDSQCRASSLWEKCFTSHCKSPKPSPASLECTWTCLPRPGKGWGRGEKLNSLTPAFFAKEATVNIALKHHKDLVETELRAVLGLGKLLSQETSFLQLEYLTELVEASLRPSKDQTMWDLSCSQHTARVMKCSTCAQLWQRLLAGNKDALDGFLD